MRLELVHLLAIIFIVHVKGQAENDYLTESEDYPTQPPKPHKIADYRHTFNYNSKVNKKHPSYFMHKPVTVKDNVEDNYTVDTISSIDEETVTVNSNDKDNTVDVKSNNNISAIKFKFTPTVTSSPAVTSPLTVISPIAITFPPAVISPDVASPPAVTSPSAVNSSLVPTSLPAVTSPSTINSSLTPISLPAASSPPAVNSLLAPTSLPAVTSPPAFTFSPKIVDNTSYTSQPILYSTIPGVPLESSLLNNLTNISIRELPHADNFTQNLTTILGTMNPAGLLSVLSMNKNPADLPSASGINNTPDMSTAFTIILTIFQLVINAINQLRATSPVQFMPNDMNYMNDVRNSPKGISQLSQALGDLREGKQVDKNIENEDFVKEFTFILVKLKSTKQYACYQYLFCRFGEALERLAFENESINPKLSSNFFSLSSLFDGASDYVENSSEPYEKDCLKRFRERCTDIKL